MNMHHSLNINDFLLYLRLTSSTSTPHEVIIKCKINLLAQLLTSQLKAKLFYYS